MAEPSVIDYTFLAVKVCVPKEFTDVQVKFFADCEIPCGTKNGWQIRREGDELAQGDLERCPCIEHPENVHIVLDA